MITFNRTDIIRHMARTVEVLSYMAWCDAWDQADDQADRPEDCVSAGPGEDWMDIATETPDRDVGDGYLIEAAILYGRIEQAWGIDPWIVLANAARRYDKTGGPDLGLREARLWGHYAVMSAVGHGVCWEDAQPALSLSGIGGEEPRVYKVPCLYYQVPMWDDAWPTEDR